jgi:beta-glucosidase
VNAGQAPIYYGVRPTGRPHDPANGWSTGFSDAPFAPRWSFGQGLSYARFRQSAPRVDKQELGADDLLTVSVDVTNESAHAAAQTLFLFSRDPVATVTRPLLELRDFTKVRLQGGETRTVRFVLPARAFSYLDEDRKPRLDAGVIQLHVGSSARACDLARVDVDMRP